MPTLHLEAHLSRRDLFRAATELSPQDLQQFATEVMALRDLRTGRLTSLADEELLELIRNVYPEDLRRRYRELNEKRADETLTPEEHAELLRLTDEVENRNAERVWALGQLAIRRKTTLQGVMQDLGIQPPVAYE
jgi:hypothetical protein